MPRNTDAADAGDDVWDRSADALVFSRLVLASKEYLEEQLQQDVSSLVVEMEESKERQDFEEMIYIELATGNVMVAFFNIKCQTALREMRDSTENPIDSAEQLNTNKPKGKQKDNIYYFYQAADGQHCYLLPLDVKILRHQYSSYENFPDEMEVRISKIRETTMDEVTCYS